LSEPEQAAFSPHTSCPCEGLPSIPERRDGVAPTINEELDVRASYSRLVPSPRDLVQVAEVLREHLPEDAELGGIRISDDGSVVTVISNRAGALLGAKQETARSISAALHASFGRRMSLNFEERTDPDPPPSGGVSEPRRPGPSSPFSSAALSVPLGPPEGS
jgi:hypothetical protein